jgi:hypothetical protein
MKKKELRILGVNQKELRILGVNPMHIRAFPSAWVKFYLK